MTKITTLAAGGYHNLAIGTLALACDTDRTNLQMAADGFRLQVNGANGTGEIVVYGSTNLLVWQPVFTNPPIAGAFQFQDSTATNLPFRFYRAEER